MVGQHDAACRKLRVLMPGRFLPFARPCKSIVLVGPNSTLYPFETAPASVWYCVADVYIATDPACSAQAGKNSPLWQPLRTKQQKPPSLQPGWAERRARRRKHRLRAVLRSLCVFHGREVGRHPGHCPARWARRRERGRAPGAVSRVLSPLTRAICRTAPSRPPSPRAGCGAAGIYGENQCSA